MEILKNVFKNPRTTLAGLWGVVMAPVLIDAVPKVAAYLGGQPGIGWQVLGALLAFVVPALMRDKKADPAPAA